MNSPLAQRVSVVKPELSIGTRGEDKENVNSLLAQRGRVVKRELSFGRKRKSIET